MILQRQLTDNTVAVEFRLPALIWGDQVMLVGDFNNWDPHATPMRQSEQYWEARLILHAGEHYSYAYLIDGVDWCTDLPACERSVGAAPPVQLIPLELSQVRRRVAAS